jgi:hypothetical protein
MPDYILGPEFLAGAAADREFFQRLIVGAEMRQSRICFQKGLLTEISRMTNFGTRFL